MKEKYRPKFIELVVIIVFIAFLFVVKLFQNLAPGPYSLEIMFSKQNIKETSLLIAIVSAIVIPQHILWNHYKNK